MTNDIKYLDQKGLKTFHDATGWVTIEIPVNGKFVVYDESPIKFINGGLMDIGNMPNQGISAGDVKRFARGTLIVNKANSEIKLEIFTRHYNQLIQHEFKTDKLTLPGTTSQVVLGDGSLAGLDNLAVGSAENAGKANNSDNVKIINDVKEGLILPSSTSTKIPLLGIYGTLDYNTPRKIDDIYLSILNGASNEFHITTDLYVGPMNNDGFTRGNIYGDLYGDVNISEYDQSTLYLTGCNSSNILRKSYRVDTGQPEDLEKNIYMYYSGENNLYSPNLHTRHLYIEGGDNPENKILQGNGQPITKSELKVGGADNLKIIENSGKYWTGTNLNPVGNKLYLSGYQSLDNKYASLISTGRVYIKTSQFYPSIDSDPICTDTLYVNDEEVVTKNYIESLIATSDDIEEIFNTTNSNTNT